MKGMIALLALLAAACATPGPSATAQKVVEGDPAVLNRDCKLLGTVNGRSMLGGSDEARLAAAVNDARERAAALGATHIVFLQTDNKGILGSGNASGRAYRCGKPAGS
ncbi:MAG: DUF4156 domain-containing protein [Burkholderiales bacterium]|nr:DUF4156 domain-containing protein [Burkholderiales bacterium]